MKATFPSPQHIAVIDPAIRVAELDNFNRLVLRSPDFRLSYHLPAQYGMNSLFALASSPDALIVFGSGASVHDNLPWQSDLHSYLKQKAEDKVPILGICYGHQALAHIFGGRVEFATEDQFKYKGLRTVRYNRSGFWGKAGESGDFIVSHREIVSHLPSSFEIFASSDIAAIEGFSHKSLPIWGVQSHPEAGPEFLKNSEIPLEPLASCFASGQLFMDQFLQHLRSKTR